MDFKIPDFGTYMVDPEETIKGKRIAGDRAKAIPPPDG
jgi:hypothetical protein